MRNDRTQRLQILSYNAKLALETFCICLNPEYFCVGQERGGLRLEPLPDLEKTQKELLRHIGAWFHHRGNIPQLLKADSALARAAYRFPVRLVPIARGKAELDYFMLPNINRSLGPVEIAQIHFIAFLLNPENDKLAGPCRECARFYIKTTSRQAMYCSEVCGRKLTSRESNRSRQEDERAKRAQAAQNSANQWAKKPTKLAWKEYVNQQTNISKNFLTRLERNGVLSVPTKSIVKGHLEGKT